MFLGQGSKAAEISPIHDPAYCAPELVDACEKKVQDKDRSGSTEIEIERTQIQRVEERDGKGEKEEA